MKSPNQPTHWVKVSAMLVCMVLPHLFAHAEEGEPATEVAVEVGKVVKTTLHRYVMAYGTVEPEPATSGKPPASSRIASPVAGIVAQILCEEGKRVEKGATLFLLDTRVADVMVAKAEVAVEFAQKNFVRKQQMVNAENVSRKLYDEAEQVLQAARVDLAGARIQRELLRIAAPLSGTVAAVNFKVGEAVGLNAVVAELIDLDRLVVGVRVPSQEAVWLRLGQSVEISTASLSGGNAQDASTIQQGVLSSISPQVDSRTDTVLARISLGRKMRPGQFVSVRIAVENLTERLAVPVESVVTREGTNTVAVVEGDWARQREVKLGLRDGKLVEVEGGGLREGMNIVTLGAYGLPHETRIRLVK